MMKIYLTHGTYHYLKTKKDEFSNELIVLMQNEDQTLLLHETNRNCVFNEPRKYDVLDSEGSFPLKGYVVMNHVPVSEEGRPVFEYRFSKRPGLIDKEPGFIAMRILRPMNSDTYIIITVWHNEQSYQNWQKSNAYEKTHEKRGTPEGVDHYKSFFPRPSYLKTYFITDEDLS